MAQFNLLAPFAAPRPSGGGFLSSLLDGLNVQAQNNQAADAYAPLLDAVYGGQGAPQAPGAVSAPVTSQPGATPVAGAAQVGTVAATAPGMGGASPQIDRASLIQMLRNPATREQAAAIIQNGGRLPQPKSTLPSDLQEYQFAQRQGFNGSFLDYQTALKKAGASNTSVTVNSAAGENAFQKTFGEGQAKRYNEMIEQGDQANSMIGDIKALQDIGTRIQTGAGAQAKLMLGPYAQALGIKIDDLPDLQAYQSIVSRLAPQMRVPGSGANSDFEARQFLLSLPSLGNQPGGNKIVEDTLLGIAQNKRAAGEIARKAGTGQITRQQADQALQELPDPFTAWRQAGGANLASQPSQEADKDGWVTMPNGVRVRQKGQ